MADFLKKWSSFKGDAPKAGQRNENALTNFQNRVAKQVELVDKYEKNPEEFADWRSTWFQKSGLKFKVRIGRDAIDLGGLQYVDVPDIKHVRDFLQDVAEHARTNSEFQQQIIDARDKRAASLMKNRSKKNK
ncbi:hypothetical protein ACQKGL_02105 [Ensifer adhaerens]|uniref:hypothetical protein n=1 Tax=Ensifer adhaerens TaxID=106592 RepID=UPI003D0309E7